MSVDSDKPKEFLTFVWWNTSLAPSCESRATTEHLQLVANLIQILVTDLQADFIALGEVSPVEEAFFRPKVEAEGYALIGGFETAGRGQFDTLFIYNRSRLEAEPPIAMVTNKGKETFRVAHRIDISVSGDKRPIHIFVSHWPSRLWASSDNPTRELLAQRLRDAVDGLFGIYENTPNVLLLGDYNDEPFDLSLSYWLSSTRDRKLAERRKHLLYNPFWRYLGAACGRAPGSLTLGGTHYYQGGKLSQWFLFDQMIFSASFLGGGEWVLDEGLTQMLDIPIYSALLENTNEYFDHSPILGVVRRA